LFWCIFKQIIKAVRFPFFKIINSVTKKDIAKVLWEGAPSSKAFKRAILIRTLKLFKNTC